MRRGGAQESALLIHNAGGVPGRIVRTLVAAIPVGRVRERAVAPCRALSAAQPCKLRVIEDIKGFHTELQSDTFPDGKALEQRHVEVCAARIGEKVSRRISKSQSTRSDEGRRIVQRWPKSWHCDMADAGIWIARQVYTRRKAGHCVPNTRVIIRHSVPASIVDGERCSRLHDRDARPLPGFPAACRSVSCPSKTADRRRSSD